MSPNLHIFVCYSKSEATTHQTMEIARVKQVNYLLNAEIIDIIEASSDKSCLTRRVSAIEDRTWKESESLHLDEPGAGTPVLDMFILKVAVSC